jgi:hypothetical protein
LLDFIDNDGSVDTFAVMCEDEVDEVAEKSGFEKGKRQSQNVFFQFLPTDIVL